MKRGSRWIVAGAVLTMSLLPVGASPASAESLPSASGASTTSPSVDAPAAGRSAARAAAPGDALSKIKIVGATPEQRAIIEQAVRDADAYIDNALKALSGPVTNPSSRYTTWFGKSDTDRFKHVRSAFIKISDQAENLEYDVTSCVHPGDVFAYVYPDQYGTVYLCSQFWKAPATGADSKAGTLVHEETHFTRNGGTDDHVYGAKRCKQLAKDDPAEAVMNADSYEYFAENTPRV